MNKLIAKAQTALWQFKNNQEGAALVEYSLLIGIITIGAIVAIGAVGLWVSGAWGDLQAALPVLP
jgi:pilus assembly protein Flp/PilA